MPSIKEALINLKKPLILEKKLGYTDRAVTKGLSAYMKLWEEKSLKELPRKDFANKIKPINNLLKGYSKEERTSRIKKLEIALRLIGQIEKPSISQETLKLESPVQYIKGVGPKRARLFRRLGVYSAEDLLYYFPRRYEDRSQLKSISQIKLGEVETIKGEVLAREEKKIRPNLSILRIAIGDGTGIVYAVWFNQAYLKDIMPVGTQLVMSGKIERFKELQILNPAYEILSGSQDDLLHTGRIVPIYPSTEKFSQRTLRQIVKHVLDDYLPLVIERLPGYLLEKYKLRGIREAISEIHFPTDNSCQDEARRRLVFEEFFYLQLALAIHKVGRKKPKGIRQPGQGYLVDNFLQGLPFELTAEQKKVINEIKKDMGSKKMMNRLIQGEVGAGKTVIAIVSLLTSVENGFQGAIMAPTEILAEQHYLSLQKFLISQGITVSFLIGSMSKKAKEAAREDIKKGTTQIIVGTHALLEEEVVFKKLGLVVIDEQHRFGVLQRAKLKEKGLNPDILVMTATPIPRTLALTVYGDLDISTIEGLPPGRKPINTYWLGPEERRGIYRFVKEQIQLGHQAYIVYPLIKKSEKLDLKAAEEGAAYLKNEIFPDLKVALIHGRIKRQEKEKIMKEFREKKIDILVSTTVIEVGIDISNVTIMVIEEAQRFGLAQLHQLRGRIGRGAFSSYCILISKTKTQISRKRLKVMTETSDGFQIAEEDLGIRGPGEFFGTRQHGLPEFKIGNIVSDLKILEESREAAFKLIKDDPALSLSVHQLLKKKLIQKFKDKLKLISVS